MYEDIEIHLKSVLGHQSCINHLSFFLIPHSKIQVTVSYNVFTDVSYEKKEDYPYSYSPGDFWSRRSVEFFSDAFSMPTDGIMCFSLPPHW